MSTVVVPLKFVEFVMTKMKCDIPFGSNVLILRDFVDQYNIKLELYRGTDYALYEEAYRSTHLFMLVTLFHSAMILSIFVL